MNARRAGCICGVEGTFVFLVWGNIGWGGCGGLSAVQQQTNVR